MDDHAKHLVDWTAAGATFAAWMEILPSMTVLLTFIWTGGRLVEMLTGTPIHVMLKDLWKKVTTK